jgi:hypothetical protein
MKKTALLLGTVVLLTGCGSVKIGRILADPGHYQGRTVSVEGRVSTAYGLSVPGLPVPGVYQVDDGSGKIYVVGNRGVPTKEARVKVKGTVTPGLSVGGRNFGTAIREESHKIRY